MPPSSVAFLALATLLALASIWLAFWNAHPRLRTAAQVFWLVVAPTWGFVLNARLEAASSSAENTRLLALPQAVPFFVAYAVTVAAFFVAVRRTTGLSPAGESWVRAALVFGLVQLTALALHFGYELPVKGLIFAPLGLPLAAPLVALALYARALSLRRTQLGTLPSAAVALEASGALGGYVLFHRLWLGTWAGVFEIFTQTTTVSGATFSTLVPPPPHGHYLCTVAAQGSPWLVRPQRIGERGGLPIVVNRQLAVANAFEDLLHERWPRFGRWVRRAYDRLGFPISRWLTARWAANLVYLGMLPLQALFELALRLLDAGDPEARVDRMYRPPVPWPDAPQERSSLLS